MAGSRKCPSAISAPRRFERLLIRSTNWIGDAIMTTPAVRAIRRHFGTARISMLAKPWVMPVFAHSPHVDDHLIYDAKGRHQGLAGKFRLARDLGHHRFDGTILLQNAFEAALITRLAKIPCRVGYSTDGRGLLLTHPVRCTPELKAVHQTDYYLGILRGIGLTADDRRLHLTIGDDARLRAENILAAFGATREDTLVGINPSATFGPAKQWFPDRFAALSDRIQKETGARILIFGGPADRQLGRRISRMMRHRPIDLSGRTTLSEAMALIDACRLFITNDSGLMHVAAACQSPLVAIFGSTNPIATGPLGRHSRVVRSQLPCSPCLKPVCPLGHLNCMHNIHVDQVAQAAEELL